LQGDIAQQPEQPFGVWRLRKNRSEQGSLRIIHREALVWWDVVGCSCSEDAAYTASPCHCARMRMNWCMVVSIVWVFPNEICRILQNVILDRRAVREREYCGRTI